VRVLNLNKKRKEKGGDIESSVIENLIFEYYFFFLIFNKKANIKKKVYFV
jgi:hypothetical protein